MATVIDWHAHHTAPEMIERFVALGEKAPRMDPEDAADFERRIADMDDARVDFQLVSQSAGVNGDRLPADIAIELVRLSNDVIADRIAAYPDRLAGSIAVTWQDPAGSIQELERMAARGFRAVMLYARPEAVGLPETDRVLGKTAELGLPIFLHGGGAGGRQDPTLERLEDKGQGVVVSAGADAAVADFCVRLIAAGTFDRYPSLQIVIRSSGGGVPLLLSKLWWKHKSPNGDEQRYDDILRHHFLVDCASADPCKLQFLIDTMGADRVVFGSDYCGGSGPLQKAVAVLREHPNPVPAIASMERNSRQLLNL
jgi:predicted TIM-barrel fold metal-dependent hydrolase